MTMVGVLGLLLGLLAWPVAVMQRSRIRITLFAIAFVIHVGSALVYYLYVQTASADTALYYYDPFDQYSGDFALSTTFVIYLVQSMKSLMGGTYLDYFFVFQAFGFFGIALLMRSIEEVYASLELPQPLWSYLLPFLPGLHFWTSAIGKDGLLFTASCLAVWSAMQIGRRYLPLGFAIILMLMIRPHIALIAVVAVAWAALADRATHPMLRTALIVGSFAGVAMAVATMKSTFQLDVTNADSISDFLAVRSNVMASDDAGTTAVTNAIYPVRLLSFLFRPLFLDAEGAFGYIASLENVIFLVIFGLMIFRVRLLWAAVRAEPFVRYALVSSIGVTLLLAMHYYNVGLGLRQKTMVLPGFLIAFVVLSAVGEARRRAAEFAQAVRATPALA